MKNALLWGFVVLAMVATLRVSLGWRVAAQTSYSQQLLADDVVPPHFVTTTP